MLYMFCKNLCDMIFVENFENEKVERRKEEVYGVQVGTISIIKDC